MLAISRKAVSAMAGALALAAPAHAGTDLSGAWRLQRAVIAPWADEGEAAIDRAWIGRTVEFASERVEAPGPLACENPRYDETSMPAEGLFQGGLPAPAEAAAQSLGIAAFPVDGVSLTCSTGIFEFHHAGDAVLFALDNVVWTLDRSPGAFARPTSPAGAVYSFLEAHFNGDMGFDEQTVAAKQKYLSHDLKKKLIAYFARPFPQDEVPPIDGDPFTDSQEYPTRFSVGEARIDGKRAAVAVAFADGFRERAALFHLVKDSARWRIDDIDYDRGGRFSEALAQNP